MGYSINFPFICFCSWVRNKWWQWRKCGRGLLFPVLGRFLDHFGPAAAKALTNIREYSSVLFSNCFLNQLPYFICRFKADEEEEDDGTVGIETQRSSGMSNKNTFKPSLPLKLAASLKNPAATTTLSSYAVILALALCINPGNFHIYFPCRN